LVMGTNMFYELVIEADELDDGTPAWMASFPAFPEIILFAETKDRIFAFASNAIQEAIAGRKIDGENIEAAVANAALNRTFIEVPKMK
jgi:predicted RNase H-like HicB family nuclease